MPLLADGTWSKRSKTDILSSLVSAMRTQFGDTIDVTEAGVARMLLEAGVALPLIELEDDLEDVHSQAFFESAVGSNLDKLLEPFGFVREPAARSTGAVHINFNAVQTTPSPYFVTGDLTFIDGSDRKYDLIADVALPGKVFDSNATGTASETIDATTTKIAQKIVTSAKKFVQAFALKHTGTGTFKVRLETDSSGSPSGTLAHANLERTGYTPTSGVFESKVWTKGAVLAAGTYWLVFERTAGSGTFDGGTTGTADQVKKFTGGSWALSTTVENLNAELIEGGSASVRAQALGKDGNIDAKAIVGVQQNNSAASTRWTSNVASATNEEAFTGGQDKETDREFRDRVRNKLASRESCSLDGIIEAVDAVSGVVGITGIENTGDIGGTENKVFDSNQTGTASETIDATNTRIAQKMVIADRRFVQHFNAKLVTDTALVCKVRLETDSSGSPSGTLVNAVFEKTGFDFNGTVLTSGTFDNGRYLEAGTYWLVFERTSGSGTFDGGTGGTADQVKFFNGTSWALSASVENLNMELIGGVPPHGFRLTVDGGVAADIAKAIGGNRAAGIPSDGLTSGTWTNRAAQSVTERWDTPTIVDVFIDVNVTKDATFTGDADAIRDILIKYVGGTDTKGKVHAGLGVGKTMVRLEAMGRLMDDDNIVGITDITLFEMGLSASPSGTSNLAPAANEKFKIQATANIVVNIS